MHRPSHGLTRLDHEGAMRARCDPEAPGGVAVKLRDGRDGVWRHGQRDGDKAISTRRTQEQASLSAHPEVAAAVLQQCSYGAARVATKRHAMHGACREFEM